MLTLQIATHPKDINNRSRKVVKDNNLFLFLCSSPGRDMWLKNWLSGEGFRPFCETVLLIMQNYYEYKCYF